MLKQFIINLNRNIEKMKETDRKLKDLQAALNYKDSFTFKRIRASRS